MERKQFEKPTRKQIERFTQRKQPEDVSEFLVWFRQQVEIFVDRKLEEEGPAYFKSEGLEEDETLSLNSVDIIDLKREDYKFID